MSSGSFSISPALTYSLTPDLQLQSTWSFDTTEEMSWTLGLLYKFSKDKQVTINYTENLSEWTKLYKASIVIQMVYEGYVCKVPIFVCNERENGWGMALNAGCMALANAVAYRSMKNWKARKPLYEKAENKIAFGYYMTALDKLRTFIHKMSKIIESTVVVETR